MGLSVRVVLGGKVQPISFLELEANFGSYGFMLVDALKPTGNELKKLGSLFNFHSFSVDNALSENQPSRVVDFDDYIFLSTFEAEFGPDSILAKKLSIFFGKHFVVLVHSQEIGALKKVFADYEKSPALFSKGPSFFLYSLLDQVVDDYFPQLDGAADQIDALEREVFYSAKKHTLSNLFKMKRKIISFRRIVNLQREVLNFFGRHETEFIPREHLVYFNDVYGSVLRVADTADVYRELVSDSLQAYLAVISNKLNEVMKVLTIIATIMLPLTLVAGFYGMNVDFPEAAIFGKLGTYFFALGLMVVIAALMLFWFRQKKWF